MRIVTGSRFGITELLVLADSLEVSWLTMILILFLKWDVNSSQSSVDGGRARLVSFPAKKKLQQSRADCPTSNWVGIISKSGLFQNISVYIYIVQTCNCTCSQEILKQHLTCSPEHSLWLYLPKKVHRRGMLLTTLWGWLGYYVFRIKSRTSWSNQ